MKKPKKQRSSYSKNKKLLKMLRKRLMKMSWILKSKLSWKDKLLYKKSRKRKKNCKSWQKKELKKRQNWNFSLSKKNLKRQWMRLRLLKMHRKKLS